MRVMSLVLHFTVLWPLLLAPSFYLNIHLQVRIFLACSLGTISECTASVQELLSSPLVAYE